MGLEIFAPEKDARVDDGPRCLVVMYHYVHDRAPNPHRGVHALPPASFRDQLDALTAMLEPIDWPTLHRFLIGEGSIPHRCFLLTFDDGLSDHARHVQPILRQRRLRGLFFVPGAVLGGNHMLPAHTLHLLIEKLGVDRLREAVSRWLTDHSAAHWLEQVEDAAARRMYHYETPERAWFKYLITMILPLDVRALALHDLFQAHVGDLREFASRWYLSPDDIRGLHSDGHALGGHGLSHEPLARLAPEERSDDLRRSFAALVELVGHRTFPFSYPYGSLDERVVMACRAAGFSAGFSTRSRWCRQSDSVFEIPRVDTIDVESMLRKETSCLFT